MTGLVAGATGAVGTALATHLASLSRWRVLGLSRQRPEKPAVGVTYVHCDLTDPASCREELARHPPVTHLFYCVRATHFEQPIENIEENLSLLENAIKALKHKRASRQLQHVHLVQGGKYYGVHLGPFPTPAREDQGRCSEPNFNHAQQDYLRDRSELEAWNWSASRPNTLLHYSPQIARNIVSTLGCYAAICRELGIPMDFPGPPGAFSSLTQVTTLRVLARAMEAIATSPDCSGMAFNVTNTDLFRWSSVWAELASRFGVEAGGVRPARLAETMADKQRVWRRICERHGLRSTAMDDVASWPFADATVERYWDEIFCHNRARSHGIDCWDDSIGRFFEVLEMYRRARILPS